MRKLIVAAVLSVCAVGVKAAPPVYEMPVTYYGTPTTVSVTTTTWTKVPDSSTLTGRTGVLVNNPNANSTRMLGHLGDCSSTSVAITVGPLEFAPGTDFTVVPIPDQVCLWVISLTATQDVHVQEISQK